MVALWLVERSISVLVSAAAAVLIVGFLVFSARSRLKDDDQF
jgi:hypothetical protein